MTTNRPGEGFNPLSKRHMSSSSLPNLASTNTARPAVDIPATMGDTDDDELMLLYDDYGDDIYLADRKRDSVIEARLTPEERRQFDDAKIKALQPWIENEAWEAADPSDAHAGEVCPMRFLLKWKRKGDGFEANARVILQGFHLHEVTSVNVDKKSPTLSRLGRSLILQVCAMKGWKLLVADVKSAFLQADDIREQGIRIFGRPTADMSAKLAGFMGLQRGQLLRMCKPAFGDVRAPLQWYKSADRGMTDAWFVKHFLDPCLYMSFRPLESNGKDDFGYMMDGPRPEHDARRHPGLARGRLRGWRRRRDLRAGRHTGRQVGPGR